MLTFFENNFHICSNKILEGELAGSTLEEAGHRSSTMMKIIKYIKNSIINFIYFGFRYGFGILRLHNTCHRRRLHRS